MTTLFECVECLRALPLAHHYSEDTCIDCAKKLDKVVATSNREEIERVQAEKERLRVEEQQEFDAKRAAEKELAERAIARRRLLAFIKRVNPTYDPGWVHADICQRLEKFAKDIEDGKSPRLMINMPPRHGKQVADSTPILTQNRGWITHGELVVGDLVFHPSGHPVRVEAVSGKTPSDYVVSISNGEEIRCHEDHEWAVYDRRSSKHKTVDTRWLHNTTLTANGRCHVQLPEVDSLEYPARPTTVDPYTLGAWLGDGSRGKGCISGAADDVAVIERIKSAGYEVSSECVHRTTGVVTTYFSGPRPKVIGRMLRELREVGVATEKFIPEEYLRNSMGVRLQLLAGLVDTDGHVDKNGRVRFTSADYPLIEGVLTLVKGLGFRPYLREEQPRLSSSGIQGRKTYWVVGFNPTTPIPCALPRKATQRLAKQRKLGITAVRYEPNGEVGHCIQVASPDGLYLVGDKLIPTHNSEIASKTFPAWYLLRNPKHEIITCSYSGDLAKDFSRKVRDLLEDVKFTQLCKTRLSKSSKSVEKWSTSVGGGFTAAGVQGPITGRGAHLAIIDDPVKDREEAESETTRQKIKDWYSSTFYSRLAPGGGVLIIQTRWHEDDLSGWLLDVLQNAEREAAEEGEPLGDDVDKWEVVSYPAIAEEDEKYRLKGEPLHEARYPLPALQRIRRTMLPRDWAALYQQRPTSEDGDYFTKNLFRFYKPADRPPLDELRIYSAGDLAISTKQDADYTVFMTVGIDRAQNIWVLEERRGRWNALGLVEQMFEITELWNPDLIGLEAGQIQLTLEPLIIKMCQESGKTIRYKPLPVRGKDKSTRARPLQGRMEQGKVFFPTEESSPWVGPFIHEMLKFPFGKNDDRVDALAWIGQMILMFGIVNQKKEKPKKSWRDKLNKYVDGGRKHRSAMSS